jgi:hypothetical protein
VFTQTKAGEWEIELGQECTVPLRARLLKSVYYCIMILIMIHLRYVNNPVVYSYVGYAEKYILFMLMYVNEMGNFFSLQFIKCSSSSSSSSSNRRSSGSVHCSC